MTTRLVFVALLCLVSLSGQTQLGGSTHQACASSPSLNGTNNFKIDCHPEPNASQSECLKRNCCWFEHGNHLPLGQPDCFFPPNFNCFDIKPIGQQRGSSSSGSSSGGGYDGRKSERVKWLMVRRDDCPASGFPDDAKRIEVALSLYGDSLINIKISEPDRRRFEPSLPEIKLPAAYPKPSSSSASNGENEPNNYEFSIGRLSVEFTSFGVLKVIHQITGTILFEAELNKLIYSRQLIQLSTYLPSSFVYGLGQHLGTSLLKSSEGQYAKAFTMFNFGSPPLADGRTAYSSYPFYINLAQLNNDERQQGVNTNVNNTGNFERRRRLIATGALMLNSNAMDVLLHSNIDDNHRAAITWRLVGGIVDLYLFAGPKPHDVINQYISLVGEPAMPPAWALGYHQSRLNYGELMQMKLAWARTRSAGIPMESIWTDLEFMWRGTSYTLNNLELNDLVRRLQEEFGMHYVPIVDPAISISEDIESYEALKLAQSMDLFATYSSRSESNGEDSEESVAVVTTWTDSKQSGLIDFTHPLIVDYLQRVLANYQEKLNFDGLWLDMNEPEVFANNLDRDGNTCASDEELLYEPGKRKLHERTLCMAAKFSAGRHFDLHNLYAFYQTKAHYDALKLLKPAKRPFIISRSQFVGQAKYSGSWLGDLSSHFDHMRWSLLGTIESNWFGQPLIGADICGFFGTSTDELCARWFSLGAFYPLARNHNSGSSKNQDPGSLGDIVQRAARIALLKRYSLLPYLYTLFYENHTTREPVIRSILFEFFDQYLQTSSLFELPQIDDQLMLGSAIMVAPVVHEGRDSRSVYLAPGRWYDVSIGLMGTEMREGAFDGLRSNWPLANMSDQLDELSQEKVGALRKPIDCLYKDGCWLNRQYTPVGAVNIFLRGGQIVPTFRRVEHTNSVGMQWKNGSFFLEIALDQDQSAFGTLYWDDGESDPESYLVDKANFWVRDNRLVINSLEDRYEEPLRFEGFIVYGVKPRLRHYESKLYRGSLMEYKYNEDTQTLVCSFKSTKISNIERPLELRKFDRLMFMW